MEWVEGCNRSSKLQYWAGVCGDFVNKAWQDGGVENIVNRHQSRLMVEFGSGCPKLEVDTGRWRKRNREGKGCVRYATRLYEMLTTSSVSVRHWMRRERL